MRYTMRRRALKLSFGIIMRLPALLLLLAVPQPADATCSAGYYGTCTPNPLVRADDNTITLTDYAVASDRSTFLVCPSDAPYLCGIVFFHQTPTPYGGMWGIKLSCCVNAGDGNPTTQPVKGQGEQRLPQTRTNTTYHFIHIKHRIRQQIDRTTWFSGITPSHIVLRSVAA